MTFYEVFNDGHGSVGSLDGMYDSDGEFGLKIWLAGGGNHLRDFVSLATSFMMACFATY